jgi:4-phytase/acid phosphatase
MKKWCNVADALSAMLCSLLIAGPLLPAQTPNAGTNRNSTTSGEELRFVVIVSRHGVRSPTGKTDQLNQYSRQPWPAWSVPPGYLTAHGARLMTILGTYDREHLAAQGLLSPSGCTDVGRIRIVADSDQRTRETGKALAQGLAPGCPFEVSALPEGTADPLFHSVEAGVGNPDKSLAAAAVSGRIGSNPEGLTDAYRPQLQVLEEVLLNCKSVADCAPSDASAPKSIFDIVASLAPGNGDHLVELRSPLNIASTMAENILLEYTEGMDATNVGWGRIDIDKLSELMQIHAVHEDITARTSYIARVESSNLLFHILRSMEQATQDHSVTGTLTKPGDRLLILVGHDTNIANISGILNLSWVIDGRRDDTPPGGALIFELWGKRGTKAYSVSTFYSSQTLDQMRKSTVLSLANPPASVPVFVPGCEKTGVSCDWKTFRQILMVATDSAFVK